MKNPSYPKRAEIEKIIAEFEDRKALREKVTAKDAELAAVQKTLRTAVVDFVDVFDDNNKGLQHYLELYRRYATQGAGDKGIDFAIAACEKLQREVEAITAELRRDEPEFTARALGVAARMEGVKRAELETLLDELTALLLPFCDGEKGTARQIAASTPAAQELITQRERCYRPPYRPEELINPLRIALELTSDK